MPAQSSIATIDQPELLEITSISPFVAKCKIKVLYVGDNRNGSNITKLVASNMAKTLPGCPIVGYFKQEKNDFRDHGEKITLDADGVEFEKLTHPVGFIPPNAKIWFQFFEETDEYGVTAIREYLLTEGFLWTQFEGTDLVFKDGGRPQSMELDPDSVKGFWTEDYNTKAELFIINDAKFKALCILGKDIEPCFEGASVEPIDDKETYNFSLSDKEFIKDLSNMMKQLQFTLNKLEGGKEMAKVEKKDKVDEFTTSENQSTIEEFTKQPEDKKEEEVKEEKDTSKEEKKGEDDSKDSEEDDKKKKVTENTLNEFEKKDEEDSKEDKEDKKEEPKEEDKKEDEKEKKDYSLLESQYNELQTKFTALEKEYESLVEFKNKVEDAKKDELIATFYMLSDEDKKEVIDNKANYSLEEIEAKLSVICVRKKVNFNLDSDVEEKKVEKEDPIMYDLNGQLSEADTLPAWLKAVEEHSKVND